ncbi:MAG TPA: hypothetical protein VFE84_01920 [Patescibacteria group bacterium]|nr:hypothetical protein [Patescibacteria group bacterium]
MQVLLFDLGGVIYALKLEAVERILGLGDVIPPASRTVDLARFLGIDPVAGAHTAVLAGGEVAVVMGLPLGATRIDPSWILPLPGYMFESDRPPFRGLIDVPARGKMGLQAGTLFRTGLLLDEQRLREAAG